MSDNEKSNEKDREYNLLLRQIRDSTPPLLDPRGFTEELVLTIEHLPNIPKRFAMLNALSWLSGMAAAVLLLVFIEEYNVVGVPRSQDLNSTSSSYILNENGCEAINTLQKINSIIEERMLLKKQRNLFKESVLSQYLSRNKE